MIYDFGGGDDKLVDSLTFAPVSTIPVQKDLILHAMDGGAVTMSFIDQMFIQVPEPSSLFLVIGRIARTRCSPAKEALEHSLAPLSTSNKLASVTARAFFWLMSGWLGLAPAGLKSYWRIIRMIRSVVLLGCVSVVSVSWGRVACSEDDIKPLSAAHAHNDYYHDRPLADALSHGFCSVEADIFLVDGQLLVGHDRDELTPERTLQGLYLDPLKRRAAQHDGRIYAGGPIFTLLVDFKSEGEGTYRALDKVLQEYSDLLCSYENGRVTRRAVQLIISGNRPIDLMAKQPKRLAFVDGRLSDLERDVSRDLMPLISDRWTSHFKWQGEGSLSAGEHEKLEAIVHKTHQRQQRLRFWATPDRPEVWRMLFDAKVDLINTDDLPGLSAFLSAAGGR